MPTVEVLGLFVVAASLLAAMPGPGQLYVVGRALASGRKAGLASCAGAALGGMVHAIAGTLGVSALLMASATAFTILKLCGGVYLIVLAIQTWRTAPAAPAHDHTQIPPRQTRQALAQALVVEATNPKTAAFFLALIPQFISPQSGGVACNSWSSDRSRSH